MPVAARSSPSRYRRRILAGGLIAAGALYSIGAPVFTNRIEADLERRVPDELAEAGFLGVVAEFSGQDGTLRCAAPLGDPEAAGEVAYDVWGVRAIEIDRSCRVNTGTGAGNGRATASASTSISSGTIAELIDDDPRLAFLATLFGESSLADRLTADGPMTLLAPTDDAFDALPADVNAQLRADPDLLAIVLGRHLLDGALHTVELAPGRLTLGDGSSVDVDRSDGAVRIGDAAVVASDLLAGNGVVHVIDTVLLPPDDDANRPVDVSGAAGAVQAGEVAATVDAGAVRLTGVVASEVERARIVDAAGFGVGPERVADQLTVDASRRIDSAVAAALAQLVASAGANLVRGTAGFDGESLYLSGVCATDEAVAALDAVAQAAGFTADVSAQPAATAEQAAALEMSLNELVAGNPIRFESNRGVLTESAGAVLDEIAARIAARAGVAVTVEGHTDSDGDPQQNRVLSQLRAEAVRQALVARGLDPARISAVGRGSDEPLLVGGVEDKPASRRVEFRVVVAG